MKKLISALVISLGIGVLCNPIMTKAESITYSRNELSQVEMNVNGKFVEMDVHPVLEKSTLFIPIRTLSSLGLSYTWNSSSKKITIQNKNGDNLGITVGNKIATKNNVTVQMDLPARNINGRILVPVRFITEALGYQVNYETIRKIVFVNSKDYSFDSKLLNENDLEAARKAAISLPLIANFKTLGYPVLKYHSYSFPVGKANTYLFSDGYVNTIVVIKDNKAVVNGQFVYGATSEFAYKAGSITKNDSSDPEVRPFLFDVQIFSKSVTNSALSESYYFDSEGNIRDKTTDPIKVYSDIIQGTKQ